MSFACPCVIPTHVHRTLDEYCDPKTIQESRKPLTLLGGNGVGKSALLAAWVRQRQNSVIAKKDMVIYHFAGCNNTSTEVRNFLYRCCSRLSKFFRLKSSVTFDEEHLTWDFPRMLEFCANKGRIIVVIDGLEMLHLVERQDNLRWLPLNFPGNVRVILSFRTSVLPKRFEEKQSSTFITDSGDETSDQEEEHATQAMQRMHAELFKRRQLPYVRTRVGVAWS